MLKMILDKERNIKQNNIAKSVIIRDFDKISPLDILFEGKNYDNIGYILEFILQKQKSSYSSILLNEYIIELVDQGMDIEDLLSS